MSGGTCCPLFLRVHVGGTVVETSSTKISKGRLGFLEIFMIHVGGARCVTSSTDPTRQRQDHFWDSF